MIRAALMLAALAASGAAQTGTEMCAALTSDGFETSPVLRQMARVWLSSAETVVGLDAVDRDGTRPFFSVAVSGTPHRYSIVMTPLSQHVAGGVEVTRPSATTLATGAGVVCPEGCPEDGLPREILQAVFDHVSSPEIACEPLDDPNR